MQTFEVGRFLKTLLPAQLTYYTILCADQLTRLKKIGMQKYSLNPSHDTPVRPLPITSLAVINASIVSFKNYIKINENKINYEC